MLRVNQLVGFGSIGRKIYDAEAAAYITATGELFPDALNTLVLGIKAAGLWDDHIGSIKKAIGVPSLAASMIDLRNTAFNGTAVNTPGHSATEGWSFLAASSQYINSGWDVAATGSKASLNSVHLGARVMAATSGSPASSFNSGRHLGLRLFQDGLQRFYFHEDTPLASTQNPAAPGHYIGVRRGASERESYKNGVTLTSDATASAGLVGGNVFIGARNATGTPDNFFTGRITSVHMGAALSDAELAALTALFDAYATAAGEA